MNILKHQNVVLTNNNTTILTTCVDPSQFSPVFLASARRQYAQTNNSALQSIIDFSSNAFTLTQANATNRGVYQTNIFGNSPGFTRNSIDDNYSYTSTNFLRNRATFSFFYRYKTPSVFTSGSRFFRVREAGSIVILDLLQFNTTSLSIRIMGTTTLIPSVSLNTIYHVGVTVNLAAATEKVKIYLNGQFVTAINPTETITPNLDTLLEGMGAETSNFGLEGHFGDFLVSHSLLTQLDYQELQFRCEKLGGL